MRDHMGPMVLENILGLGFLRRKQASASGSCCCLCVVNQRRITTVKEKNRFSVLSCVRLVTQQLRRRIFVICLRNICIGPLVYATIIYEELMRSLMCESVFVDISIGLSYLWKWKSLVIFGADRIFMNTIFTRPQGAIGSQFVASLMLVFALLSIALSLIHI